MSSVQGAEDVLDRLGPRVQLDLPLLVLGDVLLLLLLELGPQVLDQDLCSLVSTNVQVCQGQDRDQNYAHSCADAT